jgi:dihydroxyacetone kinase-like protein
VNATEKTLEAVRAMAAAMEERRVELTQLDSAIGDGDHGTNMHRGFQAALERLESSPPDTPSDVLKAVSMALVSKVGGAAGPLYGTAFLRASSALSGREELSAASVAAALEAALAGVKQRGRAEVGDKTMVDALEPAVRAAKRAEGKGVAAMLRAAAEAAGEGAEATVPLTARKGRASYLGARSAGHKDPGAASTAYLLAAAARAVEGS